jgi:hypothetical protein
MGLTGHQKLSLLMVVLEEVNLIVCPNLMGLRNWIGPRLIALSFRERVRMGLGGQRDPSLNVG